MVCRDIVYLIVHMRALLVHIMEVSGPVGEKKHIILARNLGA